MIPVAPPPPPRSALLLLVLLSVSMFSSAFPQPNLQPFQRNPAPVGQGGDLRDPWEVPYPYWEAQRFSGPDTGMGGPGEAWVEKGPAEAWAGDWRQGVGGQEKRNIAVADDAAFREKSKLLTAMERQKWLNSYMQKLLVVNSK